MFDDVRVPAGRHHRRHRQPQQRLRHGHEDPGPGPAAHQRAVGGLRLPADRRGLRFARERRQFGQPIAEFQLIQAMLADSRAEAYAAECMVMDAARRRDAGERVSTLASCCKLFATEMVGRVADRAVQIHGGAGYMEEYAVARFYRDVRLFRIYEGTSQIQQTIIARDMIRR
jgi:acyl-CoA dehydrogenase